MMGTVATKADNSGQSEGPRAMRSAERYVERRAVVEAYAKYDCSKKGWPIPDFALWDWSQADAIDNEMCCAGLKRGIPAGYLLWDKVDLTLSDLRDCAIVTNIFPEQPQKLGLIEDAGLLVGWKPNTMRAWYDDIVDGHALDGTAPLLLRPTLRSEAPASWYIEDGSGRAIALIANHHKFSCSETVAIGYLGCTPDPNSAFMQREPFRQLLEWT